ncbi:MAG: NADH-quinone oxidoreductase subunit NuoE [Planctomycetota bacterium]|jgi:NADH:ubiquinone oxidoreductase subunit E
MTKDSVKDKVVDMAPLDRVLEARSNAGPNDLIPLLHDIQEEYGYLPRPVLMELSRRSGIAASRIYGVATFYEQFHLEPCGKNTIKCCRGTACHVKGAVGIAEAIEKSLGIKDGETSKDMQFTFETVACLGTCALAPVMMVNGTYHGKMTPNHVQKIIESLKSPQEEG